MGTATEKLDLAISEKISVDTKPTVLMFRPTHYVVVPREQVQAFEEVLRNQVGLKDPDEIIAFFNQHHEDVVVKALRGTHRVPLLTQRLTKDHLVHRRGLALSPAIYQEYIPGDRHVRVCAFSNDIHAYELVSP
jgi:hypothetical protein